jgi:hydroxyacylglutathione hydrolase
VPRLAELVAGVLVATSEVYLTTSTVVTGHSAGCLVIDPALTVTDLQLLAADLATAGLHPVVGFATHPHWDHLLWCRELGEAPRYASPQTVATAECERPTLITDAGKAAPGHDLDLFGRLVSLGPQTDAIPWSGPDAMVVTHDGHAPGHSAVFLPDSGTLIAGDMCSDIEIPLLDLGRADPVGDYEAGLERLAVLPVRHVVPGHGTVADAAEFRRRVAADLAYLGALRRGSDPHDPRLTIGWLIDEHNRQADHLRD